MHIYAVKQEDTSWNINAFCKELEKEMTVYTNGNQVYNTNNLSKSENNK